MTDPFAPAALHLVQGAPIAQAKHEDSMAVLQSPGLRSIIAERIRQIEQEGYLRAHDVGYDQAELSLAAKAYLDRYIDLCLTPERVAGEQLRNGMIPPPGWPWSALTWREPDATEEGKRRALLKAIALLWAELDRVDTALALMAQGTLGNIPGLMRGSDLPPRSCRYCGCTEANACVDDATGVPCHWIEKDVCSACVDQGGK